MFCCPKNFFTKKQEKEKKFKRGILAVEEYVK